MIAEAFSILSRDANQRQVILHAECHEGPLLVRADPIHLLQVVLNLATNAMDAMADTPLDVATNCHSLTALIEHCKVEVVVTDSGPGIPRAR